MTAHHLQLCSFSKSHAMAGVTEVMLCLLEQSLIAVCMKGNQAASRELKFMWLMNLGHLQSVKVNMD